MQTAFRCDEDKSIRAVVLGATGRFFCAGGDIGGFAASGKDMPVLVKEITTYLHAAVSIFALTYTILAQRHGLVLSLTAATLVWLAAATALRLVEWTPLTAVAVFAAAFGIAIPLSARYRTTGVPQNKMRRTRYDLPLRAATAALVAATREAYLSVPAPSVELELARRSA